MFLGKKEKKILMFITFSWFMKKIDSKLTIYFDFKTKYAKYAYICLLSYSSYFTHVSKTTAF